MKTLILYLLTIIFILGSQVQDNVTGWLSKEYVEAMMENDSLAENYLFPIEGFEFHNEILYVLTYRGELNPAKIELIYKEGEYMYELLDIKYYLNLKYISFDEVERLSKTTILLTYFDDVILMELIENSKSDTIYFVNKILDERISSIKTAKQKLQNMK